MFLPKLALQQGIALTGGGSPPPPPSFVYPGADPSAALVAAGALLNEAGEPHERRHLLEALFTHFDAILLHSTGSIPARVRIMAAQLRASFCQEAGRTSEATHWFGEVVRLMESEGPAEEVALEVTLGQAKCRLAFQHASAFKRPKPWSWGLRATRQLMWLTRAAMGEDLPRLAGGAPDISARKLASYFLGDIWAAWGILAETILAPAWCARRLYDRALRRFEYAVAPEDGWSLTQSFHQMRRDEVWLLRNRVQLAAAVEMNGTPQELEAWDSRFAHYRYESSIMTRNIGLRMFLLLGALRALVADEGANQTAQAHLDEVDSEYERRGYPAGGIKTSMYRWIAEIAEGNDGLWRRLQRFRELVQRSRGLG